MYGSLDPDSLDTDICPVIYTIIFYSFNVDIRIAF